jgi:hypothetical protein
VKTDKIRDNLGHTEETADYATIQHQPVTADIHNVGATPCILNKL